MPTPQVVFHCIGLHHVFRHTMRATHAGAFTALPATAELMYFPDVRGSSNGEQWQVTPAGPVGEGR